MSALFIGQVARQTGVSVETIRFYERQGLIQEPPRRASGYRQYGENDVNRLAFIQQAKSLGFSLHEIGELLSLKIDPDATCHEVREQAQAKLQDIEEKIRKLKRMQQALKRLVDHCPGRGPVTDCPILEALEPWR
ncbi:MAG: MerR family transcriptional regulator [Gammaproteobacteria bacterium]